MFQAALRPPYYSGGGVIIALLVIFPVVSCQKEPVSEAIKNKEAMKTEVLTADFSEIYKLYHDGKLTNYKDVPFQTKEKQEALQYVENVANYLTGTPWKGRASRSQRKFFKIPNTDLWNAEQQKEFLEQILAELSLSSGEYVVAVDIVQNKENSGKTEVVYLLGGKRERKKWVSATGIYNWGYIFPHAPNDYEINTSISSLYMGLDGYNDRTHSICNGEQLYGKHIYFADRVFEYALNNGSSSLSCELPPCSDYYYINISTYTHTYGIDLLQILPRATVQTWIDSADSVIASQLPANKCFVGVDMYYISWNCGCRCYKDKNVYADYRFGNIVCGFIPF